MVLVSSILLIQQHELTHQAIYRAYGYDAKVYLTWWGGYVILEGNQTIAAEDAKPIRLLNGINELVSYQYGVMFVFITIMMFIIFFVYDDYHEELLKKLNLMD
jgi:peroxiredoxin family protein